MGSCVCLRDSSNAAANSKIFSISPNIDDQPRKILLLGAGDSGKSTILKQIRYLYIYNRGYPTNDLNKYKDTIYENLIHILLTLAKNCALLKYENEETNKEYITQLTNTNVGAALLLLRSEITDDLKNCLTKVWSDSGIKKTFNLRHEFVLMDNAPYLLECMPRILANDYVPTFTDIIYTRSVTTGIKKECFIFETHKGIKQRYEFIDVGGLRSERRKWTQCFEDVSAILFCISLSGYDQVLLEHNGVNKFEEALRLLDDLCNNERSKPLRKAKFIILLNKCDVFREKIDKVPFQYKDEFGQVEFGPCSNYEEIIYWIQNKIKSLDINRSFCFNVICATDTEELEAIANNTVARITIVFGYIRRCWATAEFDLLRMPADHIIMLIVSWYCRETVHLFNIT